LFCIYSVNEPINEDPEDEVDILVQLNLNDSQDEMDADFEPPTIIANRPVLRRRQSVITMGTTITSDTADTDCMTIMEEDRDMDAMIGEEKAEKGSVSKKCVCVCFSTLFLVSSMCST
jgi:hypothetical protein